jgi:hypothetical protein
MKTGRYPGVMELRARIRHFARPAAMTAALSALLVPAVAGTATADAAQRKAKRYPVVTSVRPMNAKVGDVIVIRGRNFIRGKNKNTVVFKRDGQRAVFAKKTLATAKQISVIVPDTVRPYLPDNTTARFRLRILSQRFSKSFTTNGASPMITALPKPVGSTGTTTGGSTTTGGTTTSDTPPPPKPVCTGDQDGDLLDASLENSLGLDPCDPDTDGDGVSDGYEYQSAKDLNDDDYQEPNQNLPYPGKRPYPNPLDKDANIDHDGDSLTLLEEYKLWKKYGINSLSNLIYSAGERYSLSTRDATGRRRPSQLAATDPKHIDFVDWAQRSGYLNVALAVNAPWWDAANQQPFSLFDFDRSGAVEGARVGYLHSEDRYYDLNGDGYLSDDERDEDADGLTNYDEAHGRANPDYWKGCYTQEKPYFVGYSGTDLTDPDTDGDGIRDGADDQDHDDIPTVMELSRNAASGQSDWDPTKGLCHADESLLQPDGSDQDTNPDPPKTLHPGLYGRVNPYNPCLPVTWSRTCEQHPDLENPPAPFDGSTDWFSLQ